MKAKPDTAVAAADRPGVLTHADQMSSEAAKHRASRASQRHAQEREVLGIARLALVTIADGLADAPTDLPQSATVKDAYEEAFRLMARNEWAPAREKLFELGLAAFGWCARIDLADMRESGEFAGALFCETCRLPFRHHARGRRPKSCPECRADLEVSA